MTEPLQVAASEAELIAMARALVAPHGADVAMLLGMSRTLAPAIGPNCAALLADALRHLWAALWRRDGARLGAAKTARGWDRHAPVGLVHTDATLRVLRWLVARSPEPLNGSSLAIGDQVVVYLALAVMAGTPGQTALATQPLVRTTPLAWLGFPELLAGTPPSFVSLVEGAGAIVVEALSAEIAHRWQTVELHKRSMTDIAELISLGANQDATLRGFMAICGYRRRRDLAAFVIDAAAPLLARGLAPAPGSLDASAPLSARAAARIGAGALLRAVVEWQYWDEEHRGVRFIDDDYAAAQLLLARFEKIGRAGADRAAGWLTDLAALAPQPAPATIETP